jgi:MFS family permease
VGNEILPVNFDEPQSTAETLHHRELYRVERTFENRIESETIVSSAGAISRVSSTPRTSDHNRAVTPGEILKRNLALSVGEGSAYGVMLGVGETYIQAFVLAIGMGEVFAALIATVPQLMGSLLQLISPFAIRKLNSHKWWVVLCAGLQSLCFLPLILAAWTGSISQAAAMLIAAMYWATSLGTGPAWNTWQGTIVPRHIRAKFFAQRAKISQITTLVGFLVGGFALKAGQGTAHEVVVFAGLFAAALLCRAVSTCCLALQTEPFPIPPEMQFLTLGEQWHRFSRGSSGRLLVFAVMMQVAVYISGPFFVPYMLKELKFEYHHYAVLIGVSYFAKFVSLPWWGRLAHITGAFRLLWIGTFGLIPLAAGWAVSDNYYWLLVLQLAAGTAWAAYELALVLLFFETIPESERTSLLTLYNVANSLALAVGSLIGAAILNSRGISASSYLCVFVASTCGRCFTLFLLRRVPATSFESGDDRSDAHTTGTSLETAALPVVRGQSSHVVAD